ncbi:ATP:cob(I)alamin adenosyltransferase, partial [Tenacibaculum sp. L6]
MKIYTKTGDKGTTALFGGTRVPKYHLRIESYGTVDELNSYIGLIRDQEIDDSLKKALAKIQSDLFTLGAMLATPPEKEVLKSGKER